MKVTSQILLIQRVGTSATHLDLIHILVCDSTGCGAPIIAEKNAATPEIDGNAVLI